MYRCINLKHSVSSGMPILYTSAQQFHVTSKRLLRRVLSQTTSAYQESEQVKGESNPPSTNQNPSIDFFGIENDEGVITVSPCKNPAPDSIQNLRNREKFYSASYGVVRYDSDNKPKRHGQYGKKFDFEFPHVSHNYAVVLKNTQNLSVDSVSTSKITNDNKDLNENIEFHANKKNLEADNYIDEFYFGNISDKENTIQNNKMIQESSDELNFLDKSYFSTLTDSEICNSSQKFINEEKKKDICIQTEHSEDELNNVNQSDWNALNSFDKINFENTVNPDISLSSQIQDSSKESFQNKATTSDYPMAESLGVDEIFSHYEINTQIKPHINVKDVNFLATEDSKDILKEYTKNNQSQMSLDITKYNNKQNKKLSNNTQNLHEMQDTIEGPNTSAKILRDKLTTERLQQQQDKNINSDVEAIKSKGNNFKYSTVKSKENIEPESAEQNDISTAHDFVTKLRKEQAISKLTLRKAKDLTEIKFDSKGFRILKNQVANLSYFTRDEILNLLVNSVAYSDNDLLVLNKPYGLVIHDSQTTKEPCLSTFLNDLAKEMDRNSNDPKLFTVHRIDKETTGCLLLAKTETMADQLKSLFALRKIIKKYWIVTTRVPDPPEGIIDIPISEGSINNKKRMVLNPKLPKDIEYRNHSKKGKEAITAYRVLSESGNAALVEVTPKTGIKHQIRVHFGFGLSCPILGDHKYSHLDKLAPQKLQNDMLERLHVRQSKVRHIPMHIHARTVIVPKYFENRDLLVNIPLPDHMKQNLKMLKFRKKEML